MLLCSTNMGKIKEFGGLLAPLGITLEPVTKHDIPEPYDTIMENAEAKAFGYSQIYPGQWILVEDSGLCVPALGGLPGAHSARFALRYLKGGLPTVTNLTEYFNAQHPRRIDYLNNEALISAIQAEKIEFPVAAYFESCVILVDPNLNVAFQHTSTTHGWVVKEQKGNGGFGYDPVFQSPETFGKTWGEIDAARKNMISHRSKAIAALTTFLCTTERPLF